MIEHIHITEPTNDLASLTRLKKDNYYKYYNILRKKGFDSIQKYIDENGNIYIAKSFLNDNRRAKNPVRATKEKAREYNRIKQQEHRRKLKENKSL